jgi:hypothetical protein
MQADDAFQQEVKKGASRPFDDRMSLSERGLNVGRVLLAKWATTGFALRARKSGF